MNSPPDRSSYWASWGSAASGLCFAPKIGRTRRVVAFKQLRSVETGERRRTLELLFEREYRTLVRLKHPRIIEVYDFGVTPAGPYYTMELLDGHDLQSFLLSMNRTLIARRADRHVASTSNMEM
jgi:serine/threonine protein kinase